MKKKKAENKTEKYNEYIRMTLGRLKNYRALRAKVENLKDDIAMMEKSIKLDVAAPISKYGDEPVGGNSELNAVEAAANRHMETQKKISNKRQLADYLELNLRKIDRAINSLSYVDQVLVRGFYIDDGNWEDLSGQVHMSYKNASKRGNKALIKIAEILFSDNVPPEQLALDFAFV